MRKLLTLCNITVLSCSIMSFAYASSNFTVYINDGAVINQPRPGFSPTILPSYEDTHGRGCYIACYSHNPINSAARVGDGIYLHGQVRVEGKYMGGICRPTGYGYQDISKIDYFSRLCRDYVSSCHGHQCWAGGDTGGWNR